MLYEYVTSKEALYVSYRNISIKIRCILYLFFLLRVHKVLSLNANSSKTRNSIRALKYQGGRNPLRLLAKSVPTNSLTVLVYEFNAGILNNNVRGLWKIRSSTRIAERIFKET